MVAAGRVVAAAGIVRATEVGGGGGGGGEAVVVWGTLAGELARPTAVWALRRGPGVGAPPTVMGAAARMRAAASMASRTGSMAERGVVGSRGGESTAWMVGLGAPM